jgi:thiosulfate/3-mercaptopyruvate sulfurtransferase
MPSVNPKPLIAAAELALQIDSRDCVVVDCRFELMAPEKGYEKYLAGHIPGARYAHLDDDLSGARTQSSGRHPLPDPNDFAACLGRLGIDADNYVVAYDDAGGAVAARLWWLLRWLGHTETAVLDGGIASWLKSGGGLETGNPPWPKRVYRARAPRADWVVETARLEAELVAGAVLLDARSRERYQGIREPIDAIAGHIPGAVNLPFSEVLSSEQTFLQHARLRDLLVARGATEPNVIAMCGSGVTACHLLLAMEVVGLRPGKLYAGSWSEWIRDPGRAVATGNKPS